MEWIFWLVLGVIALSFQLYSVFTGTRWGMLTSSVRWLRARLWGRLIVLPAWTWLTWHWLIEPRALGTRLWDDLVAIALGIVIACYADYRDYTDTDTELDSTDERGTL